MTKTSRTPSTSRCLCDQLRQTTRALTRAYDEALRPAKLRITQFNLLTHLAEHGVSRVRDLGEALYLEETTLTRNLRPLEERGWVVSRPGKDRRERHVSLTRAGEAILAKATPLWRAIQDQVHRELSSSTWDALFRTLPDVTDAAMGPPPSA